MSSGGDAAARVTARSCALYERAAQFLPLGSSTNSKRPTYMPEEPGAIVRGRGCQVWDADGNEYLDFRNGLGPVTLGYCFPAIDEAVRAQLENGIVFGHPHPLEGEIAELLCEVIPCAEQARFLKTGGEAVAATLRLARHATGRDLIVQIGYNGWLNSVGEGARIMPGQVAARRPAGVTAAEASLFAVCSWNDASGVREVFAALPGRIAAVVVACDYAGMEHAATFLPFLRRITEEHGSLLILDEIVTGFRLAIGGAHERFGIKPDLAVFAKGIANGMPLSAYVGRREVMEHLNQVGISSTYGGETLSLAAAKAAIGIYRSQDVIGHLWRMGERFQSGLNARFRKAGVPLKLRGVPPCPRFMADGAPEDLMPRFMRQAYACGVSLYFVPYVNFSHQESDIDEALDRLEKAIAAL